MIFSSAVSPIQTEDAEEKKSAAARSPHSMIPPEKTQIPPLKKTSSLPFRPLPSCYLLLDFLPSVTLLQASLAGSTPLPAYQPSALQTSDGTQRAGRETLDICVIGKHLARFCQINFDSEVLLLLHQQGYGICCRAKKISKTPLLPVFFQSFYTCSA